MRDQSKAVLNTKLQVEKSSRIQGVPDAAIIDGCVVLCTVQWPTSDTVDDNIIGKKMTMNVSMESQCAGRTIIDFCQTTLNHKNITDYLLVYVLT